MNKNYLFGFIAIVALLFVVIAFSAGGATRHEPNSQPFPTSVEDITQTPTQSMSPSPTSEVFQSTPKEGSAVDKVTIPVRFKE